MMPCSLRYSRKYSFVLWLIVSFSASSDAAYAAPPDVPSWKAGVGKENITPEGPMWMSGYGGRDAPADGTLTDLWAKALVLEDARGATKVLITLDLVGIDADMSMRVCTTLREKFGLEREAIALSTTHTHSGPVVGRNLKAMYHLQPDQWQRVDQYTHALESKIVSAVERAWNGKMEASISWGVGRATFAVNRRNNEESQVPALRESNRLRGPVDHDVPVLIVEPADVSTSNKPSPLAIVCGYACHATVLSGYQWCGDWPGYAQIAIEQQFPGVQSMVWAGCGADQNPVPRREVAHAQDYGNQIALAAAEVFHKPRHEIHGELESQYAEIPLQLTELPDRETLEVLRVSQNRFEAGRAEVLLQQWDQLGQLADEYAYPIQTWQLGDGPTWVFLGGEVVVDYAIRLKSDYDPGRTWIASYCNDVMAYIPSLRVLNEGGYEGSGAMLYYGLPGPWASDTEEKIVSEVDLQLAAFVNRTTQDPRDFSSLPKFFPGYPDHSDLSVFQSTSGALSPITTLDDWQRRREHILLGMQQVMGPLPEWTSTLKPIVSEINREELAHCTRVMLNYEAGDGDKVPAHLYLPKIPQPKSGFPAVLALHPTSHLGKRIVGGEGEKPNRNYAIELASRGYVVLAPDYPSFGDYSDYDFNTDSYQSGSMKGIVNHIRGIDLLVTMEQCNPKHIAVIGHSLGGHNAMFVSAFDTRIAVTITSCGWTPFHDYYEGKLAGWTSSRYMPRIREIFDMNPSLVPFDFYEVAATIAPRKFYSCSPMGDENFAVAGIRKAEPKIRDVYRLLGAEENLTISYPDAGHDFPNDQRKEAYELLDRTFGYTPIERDPK